MRRSTALETQSRNVPNATNWRSRLYPGPLLVLGTMLLAAVLRAHGLGELPLRGDEAWSEWFAHRPVQDAWRLTARHDTHPPLYHTLLSGWISLFGNSEAALRSLSAACSVATVPIVYLLGRAVTGNARSRTVGALAGLFFALAPVQVDFAQETRPYAALGLAVALMLYGACRVLRLAEPPQPAVPTGAELRWAHAIGWSTLVAGSALALWLHNTAALVVASVWAVLLVAAISLRRANPMLLRGLLIAGLLVALLYAPFLPYLLEQVGRVSTGFWVKAPSVNDLEFGLLYLFGSRHGHTAIAALTFCVVATLGLRFLYAGEHRWMVTLLAVAMLAPILLEFALSRVGRPFFLPRTLIYTLVPFFVFVAAGVASVRSVAVGCLMVAGLAAVLLNGLEHYYVLQLKREHWDRGAALLLKGVREQDLVFTIPNHLTIQLRHHLPEGTLARSRLVPLPGEFPTSDNERFFAAGIKGAPRIEREDLEQIRRELPKSGRVWLVMHGERGRHDPDGLVVNLLRDQGFQQTLRQSLRTFIVLCFERVGASEPCSG